MNKALTAIALAGTLFLANCSTLGGGLPTQAQITAITAQAQSATQTACGFLPTAQTIGGIAASLFPNGAPIETMISTVASAICNALTTHAAVRGRAGVARFHGVPIHGHYVS
jgi:hypothetical protein